MALNRFGFFVLGMLAMLIMCGFAHAQVASSGQQPAYTNTVQMAEHPMHADQGTSRPEVSLLGTNNVTSAHGERPLWEFGPVYVPAPLGDVARAYRKEHATAEKAQIHWEQQ